MAAYHRALMSQPKYDCGIVIALREEYEGHPSLPSFRTFFEIDDYEKSQGTIFFNFNDELGTRRTGVAEVMQAMTPIEAYKTTRDMIEAYSPRVMVNIGIAGSLSSHIRLGDVIVANFADEFDYRGKAVTVPGSHEQFTFEWGGQPFFASEDLYHRIQKMWSYMRQAHQQWMDQAKDRLKRSMEPSLITGLEQQGLLGNHITLRDGPIASGNTVDTSEPFTRSILKRNRTLLAIEMEAAGFLKACTEHSAAQPRVVIKAISDFADNRKEQLDAIGDNLIRAWAIGNAFDLLGTVCRRVFEYDDDSKSRKTFHDSGEFTADVREEVLAFSTQRHFKKLHRLLPVDLDSSLQNYDSLFRPIIDEVDHFSTQDNIFVELANDITLSTNPYPLRINGKPGTGKTTFLTLLYLALYRNSKTSESMPVPLYLNLRRYLTPERGREHDWQPLAVLQDDLAFVERILDPKNKNPIIILIDGIDEYMRHDENVEAAVLELVQRCDVAKKVVGIGLNHLADKERFKRELAHLNNPERTLTLTSIPIRDEVRLFRFIDAYQIVRSGRISDNSRRQLLERAASFRLLNLDLLSLSMLVDSVDSDKYAKVGTLSGFFTVYCEQFLHTDGHSESLSDAAKIAFEYTVKADPVDLASIVRTRAWKLLNLHSTIKDFLVAYHAVRIVRAAGKKAPNARLADLDYVYPHSVNRFCKDLINVSREVQFDALEGAKQIFREGGANAKPHGCYLAGRVTDHDARLEATTWLQACRKELEDAPIPAGGFTRTDLLLRRTVYISLAYLGDEEASEAYINLLIANAEWNDVNRGFHLEYYDDIPFDPDRLLSHGDRLGSFTKTYENLRERLNQNLDNREYGLFNIEAFTLYSLAQYRHAKLGKLENAIREDLRNFIPKLLASENLSHALRDYLKMLAENFEGEHFPVGRLAEKLYGLKTELRAGWLERNLPLRRVESVADHVVGAYLLGLLYLPEENRENWRGYDKGKILSMLMVHDLAESIVGDVTPPKVTVESKEKERDAFKYINLCRTYNQVANMDPYYRLWDAFEHESDENARIAKDLDKLENLVQLYLYQREYSIPDFNKWRLDLSNSIATVAGKRILNIVKENFG